MEEGSGEMGKGDVLREESTEWLTAAVGGEDDQQNQTIPKPPQKPHNPPKTKNQK